VLGECLAVLLAWHGGQVADLTSEVVDGFEAELAACMTIPPSSRRAYRSRLAGVRQLLFEIRIVDTPPRRRPWARTLEQRFADVAMAPEIRRALLRYVQARAAVLRPRSVESLVNDLLPFAEYLTASQSGITSLRQLRRDHVEGYLAWNRTRPWRGQRAAAGNGRVISAAVAQSTVLSLRNMLDDIAARGGPRHRPAGWCSPLHGRKSASKTGSSTIFTAACTIRSRTGGIDSGLCSVVPGFGMNTRRAGSGRYRLSFRSADSSPSSRATPYSSTSARLTWSMPAAPRLRRTSSHALSGTSLRWTLSDSA
jgi:hypothetical protein